VVSLAYLLEQVRAYDYCPCPSPGANLLYQFCYCSHQDLAKPYANAYAAEVVIESLYCAFQLGEQVESRDRYFEVIR
jgi:hypothetical protein